MFRHALRLVWNRRRANRLVVIEIAAAFVVTFILIALAGRAWINYQRPLGFAYADVWRVPVVNENEAQSGPGAVAAREIDDMLDALRALPGVDAAHSIGVTPFLGQSRLNGYGRDENSLVSTMENTLSTAALESLGVRVIEGRPFGPEDEGQNYSALLVNRTFVERAFGNESPLGKRVNFWPEEFMASLPADVAEEMRREVRVVGIFDDFRQHGDLAEERPYAIRNLQPGTYPSSELFVKVSPGTSRSFEERIIATVEAVAPGWRASVTPWEELRENALREVLLPLKIGATLGAFLLAMVALGLIGIVWQDVVRRTQEIGLRRAAGASAPRVRRQIVLEMLVVGLFGAAIGTAIAVQFPLLEILPGVDWTPAAPALAASAALILGLAAAAALYPAWLASRREPADALRYE